MSNSIPAQEDKIGPPSKTSPIVKINAGQSESKDSIAVNEIRTAWRNTASAIIETAKLVAKWNSESNWLVIRTKLEKYGVMQAAVTSMMVKIGNSDLLTQPENLKILPSSYNSLYHLSKMHADDLKSRIKNGEVNPSLRLKEVKSWAVICKVKSKKKKVKYCRISVSQKYFDAHKEDISTLMDKIKKDYPYLNLCISEGA